MVSTTEHVAFIKKEMYWENEARWYLGGGILSIFIPFGNLGKKLNFSVYYGKQNTSFLQFIACGKLIKQWWLHHQRLPREQMVEQLSELIPSYTPWNLQQLSACKIYWCKSWTNAIGGNPPLWVGFWHTQELGSIYIRQCQWGQDPKAS